MGKISDLITSVRVGAKVVDLGQVDETVIRFKGYYISVMENEEGIASLSWSDNPSMFQEVPVRDFWIATKPTNKREGKYGG